MSAARERKPRQPNVEREQVVIEALGARLDAICRQVAFKRCEHEIAGEPRVSNQEQDADEEQDSRGDAGSDAQPLRKTGT